MKLEPSWRHFQQVVTVYAAALLFVAVAAIITGGLRKVFPAIPNALFFCAVLLSAWFGGWGPGLLSSILSSTIIIFILQPPLLTGPNAGSEVPRFFVFLFATVFISWLCVRRKQADAALRQARNELEQRVNERTREVSAANEELKTEITERKRAESLLDGQKRVLEKVATGAPLSESLNALVLLIEAQVPGMLGSILLLDNDGFLLRHAAAPGLPADYVAAIDGTAIGPEAGSCGTAAYLKGPVLVEDIATDARWRDYKELALSHGLRACWSTPIFNPDRRVLGTFAMYYRAPALPKPEHLRLIEMAAHIASVAICDHVVTTALRESETRLKEAERIGHIGYWQRDLLFDRITWSEETCRIFGLQSINGAFSQAELQQMIHPDDRQLQADALNGALQGSRLYDVEYRIRRPDGEVRFLHVRDEIEYDGSGRPVRMFGTAQDITERKLAEAKLREHEELLRVLTENTNDFIRLHDLDRTSVYGSPSVERLYGRQPAYMFQFTHPEDMETCLRWWNQAVAGDSQRLEWRVRGADGEWHWLETSASRLEYRGQPRILTVCRDVTERKRAEAFSKAQEREIRAIVENSPDPIVRYNRELRRTYVNPAFIKAMGVPKERLLGKEFGSAVKEGVVPATTEEVKILQRSVESVFATRRPLDFETSWPLPDGRKSYVVHLEPEFDADGDIESVLSIARDITERKRAEEAVEESRKLLQQVLATLPVGVAVTNQMGDVVFANAASKRIWAGMIVSGDERRRQSKGFWHDSGKRLAPGDWASVRALTTGQTILNELIDIETFDDQQKTILNSAAPIRNAEGLIVGAVIVNEDVTEAKKSEQKLRRTEAELAHVARLTMMGELTATIAHEVNQPLAAVVTNANAVSRWLAAEPPNLDEARQAIQRIVRDGNRAGEVIRRIRALLKKEQSVRTPLDLNELVAETVALAQPELKHKKISLRTELASELPRVAADRVQLQQVLLNLVMNAVDSVSAVANRPRVLHIRTDRPEPDKVRVAVQDSGIGIEPQESERLFQPFYTTKPQGLGMGLAISRSIVEAHGGQLWATPNDDGGATFQFTVPVQDGGAS